MAQMKGKSKVISKKEGNFAKGGTTKMFGRQFAGPDSPGSTGKDSKGTGGKFAAGGSTKMLKEQHAVKRKAGITGKY